MDNPDTIISGTVMPANVVWLWGIEGMGVHCTYIGGMVAPFAMRLESLLVDGPQQGAQVTELHHNHNDGIMTLNTAGSCWFSMHSSCAT